MTRSTRIAVVSPLWGDPWREEDLVVERVAAALACEADVEVLTLANGRPSDEVVGALRVRRFRSTEIAPSRRDVLLRLTIGRDAVGDLAFCGCFDAAATELVAGIPRLLQLELARAEWGDSPELVAQLRDGAYDVVVFGVLGGATTVLGIEAVAGRSRTVLLPLARRRPSHRFEVHREALARADRALVLTATEGRWLEALGSDRAKIRDIGFALRIHELAAKSEPVDPTQENMIPVVRDWTRSRIASRVQRIASKLADDVPEVRLLLLGRGAEREAGIGRAVVRYHSLTRPDLWRWTSRGVALLEPEPNCLLGVDALEAMMLGVPLLVHADSGAAREHAEVGNGGLWYRTHGELRAAIGALLAPDVRSSIGEQARRYALARYGDPDAFIARVGRAVLGTDGPAPLEATPAIG